MPTALYVWMLSPPANLLSGAATLVATASINPVGRLGAVCRSRVEPNVLVSSYDFYHLVISLVSCRLADLDLI
jgi:hypothetical protein